MGLLARTILLLIAVLGVVAVAVFAGVRVRSLRHVAMSSEQAPAVRVAQAVQDHFNYLSKNGNSSCATSFMDKMKSMDDGEHLRGSCCSAMQLDRYNEQVTGLQAFKAAVGPTTPELPADPYDIPAGFAKQMAAYYDTKLSPGEQATYDYAMQHSNEKGPCCCQCWRWFVTGGLGKYVISTYKFTGEQVTQLWNLLDGCGGNG